MKTLTMYELTPLQEAIQSPTPFDSPENYAGEIPGSNWLCVLARTRDSDAMEDSNFIIALRELGGEGETVRVDRVGHWACGWIEYLSVSKWSESEFLGQDICDRLNRYPVLDDEHFSQLQRDYGEITTIAKLREPGFIPPTSKGYLTGVNWRESFEVEESSEEEEAELNNAEFNTKLYIPGHGTVYVNSLDFDFEEVS